MKQQLTKIYAAVGAVFFGAILVSCQVPADSSQTTVRRAESARGGSLFSGAGELNVPWQSSSINAVARMLAGMPVSGGRNASGALGGSSALPWHEQQMDALWRQHESGRGQRVRSWASREINDLQRHRALFYPFSGPDYLFAHELFPHAETIIMCGLEPAEPLPDVARMSAGEVAAGLQGLRTSLSTIMNAGYFITKDMRQDLQSTRFRGTLPILLAFLARSGAAVESVDIVRLDGTGTPVLSSTAGGAAPGLMIRYKHGFGGLKRLFYFRQDLANGSLRPGSPLLTFVARQGAPPVLLKSASYLMQDGQFSVIKNFILRNSSGIVQDPSGVPWRDLAASGMDLRLYGNYQGTLAIFSQQPDLRAAYQSGRWPVQPVDFGFGYLFRPSNTSIIVARRR